MIMNAWWMAQLTPTKTDCRADRIKAGITLGEAAQKLGVTREHLSRVLHGHRESRSLTRRFAELQEEGQP
jgi:transcriptional regulator with XRE-family HTH domain